MKKIIIFSTYLLLNVVVYGQTYSLSLKGSYSSSSINGYVGDAAFYNDTCYFISGDGKKILMTKSNGTAVSTDYFASATFNGAMKIYADDTYILVLDFDYLRYYTKKGELKYSIDVATSGAWYSYFWVKNKKEIMLVSVNRILIYDYSTRELLKNSISAYKLAGNQFLNDGNKLYDVDARLITCEYKGGTIVASNITTPKYLSLRKNGDYLACFINNESLWFNYFDRSKAFFVNSDLNSVVRNCTSFLPSSKNPTDDDLYIESGNPQLKVYHSQDKTYVINAPLNKVEFYMLEKK
ncbi:hypothetical protein AGMMS50262_20890 [Bacteroidia bacterium]|nr:hypothetical protein AGMMS50262_20890 [Bacteroidia bacterium]